MKHLGFLLTCVSLGSLFGVLQSYKPVIIVHGMLDGAKEMHFLRDMILKAHPGTVITIPDVFSYYSSLEHLWKQYPYYVNALKQAMEAAADGVHLVCFSQGGLMCRAIVEQMDNHNVENLILLSSPQMGQFGDTSYVPFLPDSRYEVYRFCYETFLGQHISICEYWNDPYHQAEYLEDSDFLAVINNQTGHNASEQWRANFIRLKNVVMLGGPEDGVITPWQSSHFATYDKDLNIVEMEKQEVYLKDYFGLKTLDSRNALHHYGIAGVNHTFWHRNQSVFDCCIGKWLT